MRSIRKSFAGIEVLHGVDLTLHSGEVLALLGENGAGKSTLVKILNGDYTKDAGQIVLDGEAMDFSSPRDAQHAGIRVIYQELNDAADLSVTENVLLGQLPRKGNAFPFSTMIDWNAARARANAVLASLKADFSMDWPMRRLSVGQRQIVEIAKALSATTKARVLVMDEPTAALTPREVEVLFKTIESLRAQGVGIIYISHRLDEVRQVAQRVMVLRDGNVAGVVDADAPRREIVRMMVGRDVGPQGGGLSSAEAVTGRELPQQNWGSRPALEVKQISLPRAFRNVSFTLRGGEILGMFGLLGAGHLQVTRALFGIRRLTSGEVFVQGRRARIDSPRSARRHGIGLVSEDRKMEAIVPMMSVADNLMYSHWPAVARGGVISLRNQTARAKGWVQKLGVRVKSGVQQPIATLSGGNQQKVILARWLEAGVKILLLNEPTRGVDVGARSDIYTVIDQLRRDGLAVIVCSSDLEEILEVSDRVLVFARGQIVSEFARSNATEENLLAAAAG
jgi:ribose transport system ATP-binding protein